MALTEETDLRQFAWVTAPGWAKQSRQRWSPDQVNRIALVYVNNRQKDSTYTYEKACKTCGYLYNHINGIWQKGKTKDDKNLTKCTHGLKVPLNVWLGHDEDRMPKMLYVECNSRIALTRVRWLRVRECWVLFSLWTRVAWTNYLKITQTSSNGTLILYSLVLMYWCNLDIFIHTYTRTVSIKLLHEQLSSTDVRFCLKVSFKRVKRLCYTRRTPFAILHYIHR